MSSHSLFEPATINLLSDWRPEFTEGFDTADLKDARALLDELS
jgi:hypothetical protein